MKLNQLASEYLAPELIDRVRGKRVAVGLSGGVDSSVCLALLKGAGADVLGLFMKNWDESQDSLGQCSAADDYTEVVSVCERFEVPYYSVNFTQEYKDRVFEEFVAEYKKGRTPNPDILCNREIKFDAFVDYAEKLGCSVVATGHYAKLSKQSGGYQLMRARDESKDQSYFLYQVPRERFSNVVFPLQDLKKSDVRAIATSLGLSNANRKDSTGICFIGERPFREFLKGYIPSQKGEFRQLNECVVGSHEGSCFYTLGQRKGLGLGGAGRPWYVVGKDPIRNIVYVERGEHPAMYRQKFLIEDVMWANRSAPKEGTPLWAKARYRQRPVPLERVEDRGDSTFYVSFRESQRAPTPGQSCVFYDDEGVCIGGGIIA